MEPADDDLPSFEGSGLTTMFEGAWATVQRLRKGKLVVVAGADQGKELEIAKPRVTGGRSIISDLVLADKAVSQEDIVAFGKEISDMEPFAQPIEMEGT